MNISYLVLICLATVESKECYREIVKETGCDNSRYIQQNVAFSAYMSEGFVVSHSKSLSKGRTLIFDKTETNSNKAYNTKTGVFKAPYNGMYAFTWTICTDSRIKDGGQLGEFGTELVINGVVGGALHADTEAAGDDECSTAFVVKYVTAGSAVFLRNHYEHQGSFLSRADRTRTTFSGWKLY